MWGGGEEVRAENIVLAECLSIWKNVSMWLFFIVWKKSAKEVGKMFDWLFQLPNGTSVEGATFKDGHFLLNLANPVQDGVYECHIIADKNHSTCSMPTPSNEHSSISANLTVNTFSVRLMLIEERLGKLEAIHRGSGDLLDEEACTQSAQDPLLRELEEKLDNVTAENTVLSGELRIMAEKLGKLEHQLQAGLNVTG